MPVYAKLPDGTYAAFPDDWDAGRIDATLRRDMPELFPSTATEPPPSSLSQQINAAYKGVKDALSSQSAPVDAAPLPAAPSPASLTPGIMDKLLGGINAWGDRLANTEFTATPQREAPASPMTEQDIILGRGQGPRASLPLSPIEEAAQAEMRGVLHAPPDPGAVGPQMKKAPVDLSSIGQGILDQFLPNIQQQVAGARAGVLAGLDEGAARKIQAKGVLDAIDAARQRGDRAEATALSEQFSQLVTQAEPALMGPVPADTPRGPRSKYFDSMRAAMSDFQRLGADQQQRREDAAGSGPVAGYLYDLGSATANMGPTLAAAKLLGAGAGSGVMAGQTLAQEVPGRIAEGETGADAALGGVVHAAAEVGTEVPVLQTLLAKGLPAHIRIPLAGGLEMTGEMVNSLIQDAYDKGTITPEMTLPDIIKNALYSGAVGFGMGTTLGAGSAALEAVTTAVVDSIDDADFAKRSKAVAEQRARESFAPPQPTTVPRETVATPPVEVKQPTTGTPYSQKAQPVADTAGLPDIADALPSAPVTQPPQSPAPLPVAPPESTAGTSRTFPVAQPPVAPTGEKAHERETRQRQEGLPVDDEGNVTLVHYSKQPGLTELDPEKYGSGIKGAEKTRAAEADWLNRTHFGVQGYYTKEGGLGNQTYETKIPAAQVYDLAADPMGLQVQARRENGTLDFTKYERLVRDAGYSSAWVQMGDNKVVVKFDKTPVTPTPREFTMADDVLQQAAHDTKASKNTYHMDEDVQGVVVGSARSLDHALAAGRVTESQLQQDWKPTLDLLRERYGDSLILHRADAPISERDSRTRTLLYGDRALADKFAVNGRKTEPRRVKIDDILAVYANADGYYEFVVRKPDTGTPVSPATPATPAPAPVADTTRPVLPETVDGVLGSVKTRPIAAVTYRDMGADSLYSLLSDTHANGPLTTSSIYVTDNPDLALGQRYNTGIMVQFRSGALSGDVHQKPGTAIPGVGNEYKTDVVGKDAVDQVLIPDGVKLRGLVKVFLHRHFDATPVDNGTLYVRKGTTPSQTLDEMRPIPAPTPKKTRAPRKPKAPVAVEPTVTEEVVPVVEETTPPKGRLIDEAPRAAERDEALDPLPAEAAMVQKGLEGGDLFDAARFVMDNGAPAERAIAERVLAQMQRMKRGGVVFSLHVAHVGDEVPSSLTRSRGITAWRFTPKVEHTVDVWLNGADVTGKVGVSMETLLHELVHAVTNASVVVGNKGSTSGTQLAKDVKALYDVTNAVITHFNSRVILSKTGEVTLTPFEQEILENRNNALKDADEVLAWGLTNAKAQAYFETIPYNGKQSVWSAFVEAIRNLLGIPASKDTALSEILRVAEGLFSAEAATELFAAEVMGGGTSPQTTVYERISEQVSTPPPTPKPKKPKKPKGPTQAEVLAARPATPGNQPLSVELTDPLGLGVARLDETITNLRSIRKFWRGIPGRLRESPKLLDVADKVARGYDKENELLGRMSALFREAEAPFRGLFRGKDRAQAHQVFRDYMSRRENGRPTQAQAVYDAASPAEKVVIDTWQKIAKLTGQHLVDIGMLVQEGDNWRPLKLVDLFFPRRVKAEVYEWANNPEKYPQDIAALQQAAVDAGKIKNTPEARWEMIQDLQNRSSDTRLDDYFAGVEMARGKKPWPETFYDYSWDAGVEYVTQWAARAAQVEFYGQKGAELDIFERAKKYADADTKTYLDAVIDSVYRARPPAHTPGYRMAQDLNQIATLLMLTTGTGTIRNLLGGMAMNAANMGVINSITATGRLLVTLRKSIDEAKAEGVQLHDILQMDHDRQQYGGSVVLAKYAKRGLTVTGFLLAEEIVRTQGMLMARAELRDALRSWNKNIDSRKSRQYLALAQRNGFDYRTLLAENGQGPETGRYVRHRVISAQGSYTGALHPAFMDTIYGKFAAKFGKWGTNSLRQFDEDILTPFAKSVYKGEEVTYDRLEVLVPKRGGGFTTYRGAAAQQHENDPGATVRTETVTRRVRTFWPLFRYVGSLAAAGQLLLLPILAFFGSQDLSPDDDELEKALADDDLAEGILLALMGAWEGLMSMGFGGVSQPAGTWVSQVTSDERVDSPLFAPIAPVEEFFKFVTRSVDEGKVTQANLQAWVENTIPGLKNLRRAAWGPLAGLFDYEDPAILESWRRDKADLARRKESFVDDLGLEGSGGRRPDGPSKNENSDRNLRVVEAIIVGRPEAARALVDEALLDPELNTLKVEARVTNSAIAAVRRGAPFYVFEDGSAGAAIKFKAWLQENAGPGQYEAYVALQERYIENAVKAGLMSASSPMDDVEALQEWEAQNRPRTKEELKTIRDIKDANKVLQDRNLGELQRLLSR